MSAGPSARELLDALLHSAWDDGMRGWSLNAVKRSPRYAELLARADAQPRLVADAVAAWSPAVGRLAPVAVPGLHAALGVIDPAALVDSMADDLLAAATEASAGAVERCAGDHQFQPILCSRCGAHGDLNLSIVGEDERLDITKKAPAVGAVDDRMAERCAIDGHRWVSIGPGQKGCLWCVATEPPTPPTPCAAHGQDHSDGCPE